MKESPAPSGASFAERVREIEVMASRGMYEYDETLTIRDLIAAVREQQAALNLLVLDVQDYEAWQRPCYALDEARAALTKWRLTK